MKCPKCGSAEYKVIDSRITEETVRRRRECLKCGNRWSTAEISIDEYRRLSAVLKILVDLERIVNKFKALEREK